MSRAGRPFLALLALVLVLVLVLAQALGLMHRIVHAPLAPAGEPLGHVAGHSNASGSAAKWVAGLFAGHQDDSTCRLFDPLNHDAPPAVAVVALPLVLVSTRVQQSHADFVARWASLFDARGPPALR